MALSPLTRSEEFDSKDDNISVMGPSNPYIASPPMSKLRESYPVPIVYHPNPIG